MKPRLLPVGMFLVALGGGPMLASAALVPSPAGGSTRAGIEARSLLPPSSEARADIAPGGQSSTAPMIVKGGGSSGGGAKSGGKGKAAQRGNGPGQSDKESGGGGQKSNDVKPPNTPRTLEQSPPSPRYTPRTTR